ncbi:DUF6479 family protein [Allostreptomyces psammosilenae]|uniref:Uncharacterized protein n=1 Tax=Allostreptomyces psammosilenae TaxID=1892865 RepID=A0A852ZWG4_9ACTN|nr:DUF6479 family protein [Allostreptomyces psammosilenae]NYI06017.1 hypothetical protein [Allostreptomyces psammosilenae]
MGAQSQHDPTGPASKPRRVLPAVLATGVVPLLMAAGVPSREGSNSNPWFALFVIIGVIAVAVLLGAFIWGRRVQMKEPPPESHTPGGRDTWLNETGGAPGPAEGGGLTGPEERALRADQQRRHRHHD